MATLYRKYRPQDFSEVVGQNHIKITLEHEIEQGKIAHAYLFCGPRAVGKTTLARIFSKAINCTVRKEGEHEPCNKCEICQEITAGRSLDIMEMDAATHTQVDNVRDNIIAAARIAPSRCKYKVFIIDEVHMLSTASFNALLKVMEEPPAYVVFILCTTEVHKVPNTIISRCQRFDFKRIGVNEITKKLNNIVSKEGVKIDIKILEAIARQSEGHMRDAESLLGQVVAIGGKEITQAEADLVIPRSDMSEAIKLIDLLNKKDASGAIGLVNSLVDDGVDLKIFVSDLIELLRKIMIAKINPVLAEKLGLELGESFEIEVNKIIAAITLPQVLLYIDKFISARNELKSSFIIQLPLELAVAEICSGSNTLKQTAQLPSKTTTAAPHNFQQNRNKPETPASVDTNTILKSIPAGFNKELIISKWHEVLAKVKSYNHSLSFILRACQPVNVTGNQVCLAFKYKFHKDRIGDINIKRIVEKIFNEVYGLPLVIEAIVDESLEIAGGESNVAGSAQMISKTETAEDKADDNMIDNLLKTFGGKIIN